MGRQKRTVKFSDNLIDEIREYLNLEETIKELQKRYYEPELAAYIESQNSCAQSVVSQLAKLLNLKGKAAIKQVESEYDYYISQSRFMFTGCKENKVKPEYRIDNNEKDV